MPNELPTQWVGVSANPVRFTYDLRLDTWTYQGSKTGGQSVR
jgi:hypothetical protein